jgi:hypothetical protein
MIFAIRNSGHHKTLVEFEDDAAFDAASRDGANRIYWEVTRDTAHRWVLDGKEHETGLWVDEGKVRYAEPQS